MKDLENAWEKSVVFTNTELEMSITYPVRFLRGMLSDKEIKVFFEDLIPIINHNLQEKLGSHKCQLSEHVYLCTSSET